MSEQQIQQAIRKALGRGDARLWRNNTGTLLDRHGRPVQFGLCKGSSDLIGLRRVTVTAEMVGLPIAVFAAVEVKAERGRITSEQAAFIDLVQEMGGFAGVARSVEDAANLLLLPY